MLFFLPLPLYHVVSRPVLEPPLVSISFELETMMLPPTDGASRSICQDAPQLAGGRNGQRGFGGCRPQ